MSVFEAYEKNVEVTGDAVISVVNGMGEFEDQAYKILSRNGIKNPQPGKWYLQQNWLDAFKDIYIEVGKQTLKKIGNSIPKSAVFPEDINGIEKALASIDIAYHMNHRGGEIGHYGYEKTGDREAIMKCENPYACDFDYGIIEEMARRFKPSDSPGITITHLEGSCRNEGDEYCTYVVKW